MFGATIVTRSRLPYARVLGASFLRHHPTASFVVLVIDGPPESPAEDRLRYLPVAQLGLAPGLWDRLVASYEAVDLSAALTPFLLQHLLTWAAEGEDPAPAVVHLAPEMRVVGELAEAVRLASRHGVSLVPRVLGEMPDDGDRPCETDLRRAGLINDGVICVGVGANTFLTRWQERVVSPAWGGRDSDRTWLGWAPQNYGARIIRDAGYGVSYWNLPDRPLSRPQRGGLRAGGRAARLLDLTGYDPNVPWLISREARAGSRVRPGDLPVLAEELKRYATELRAGGAVYGATEFAQNGTPDDADLELLFHSAFRRAFSEAQMKGCAAPVPPRAGGGFDRSADWLRTPVMGPASLQMGPLEREMWHQRTELQIRFPDPAGADAVSYRTWLDSDPEAQAVLGEGAQAHAAPVIEPTPAAVAATTLSGEAHRFGWNLLGPLEADSEIGEVSRRIAAAFRQAAVLTREVTLPDRAEAMTQPVMAPVDMAHSLLCVNPNQLSQAVALTRPASAETFPGSQQVSGRRVGLWFWELERFPSRDDPMYSAELDEIWCPSRFVADAVSPHAQVPVKVIPVPASTTVGATRLTRETLGLPNGFVFYLSYELGPALERRNPVGLIQAYCRAFGPDDGVSLVLRSADGRGHPHLLAQVRWEARGRADVHVIDATLDPVQRQGMIELTDCFVSLHRAEAFGAGMAAAMMAARPVIATAYSGNLDFMDDRSAYLVPYALRPVGPGKSPYPASAVWADPDLAAAAGAMRQVFDQPTHAAEVGLRAAQRIRRTHGLWQSATVIAREAGITLPRRMGPAIGNYPAVSSALTKPR